MLPRQIALPSSLTMTANAIFNGGKAILYTINLQNTAIAKGQIITFAFSDPTIISTIMPNARVGAQYGD